MTIKLIDPIVVREERNRLEIHERAMQTGREAADALLWFQEYATPPSTSPRSLKDASDVLTTSAQLVASSTPNAKIAQTYVTEAARRFSQQILEAAIEAARTDFDRAERVRRQQKS